MSGIRTTNLERQFSIDELIGNVTDEGVERTARIPMTAIANMLAGTGAFVFGNMVYVQTRAQLLAITPDTETAGGVVLNDPNATYNGYYSRVAAAWVRQRGFPDSVATLENVAGTGNAITADTVDGVDPATVQMVILNDPPGTNSTGAATLTLNGVVYGLKSASGANPAAGDIIEGVGTAFFRSGAEWRQIFSSATGASFDHQGDWSAVVTYTEAQVVTGSNGNWYQLKVASALNDNPVGSVTGNWLLVLAAGALADNAVSTVKIQNGAVTDPKVADSFRAKIVGVAADRTALSAMDGDSYLAVNLMESGREGLFRWDGSNLSAQVSVDTLEGVYVAPTDGSTGAWVRQFDRFNYWTKWFGAVGDYTTDNTSVINSMMSLANLVNTSTTAGRQTAFFINVEGGVKFSSANISWLPNEDWIHVYINYFVNSDITQGAAASRSGTNERAQLSVNSGYPNDATGGFVGESIFSSPLHPAIGVNVHKNVDNSIAAHEGANQAIQPNASLNPARATVAYICDEGFNRFSLTYHRYGSLNGYNGVYVTLHKRLTNLIGTGFNGAGAWGANVPVAGDVVRGMTSNGRYVVYDLATTDILRTEWLSGTAVPGEYIMRERAIFKGSISGTTLTVTSVLQGTIAVGHTIVGMYVNSGITAATTITALGTGAGGVGTYTINNSQTISSTEIVSGFVSANTIQGGGVGDTDSTNVPMQFDIDGWVYTRDPTFARGKVALTNGSGASTGTLTNAPNAGNPSKWIKIDDAGVTRWIPAW